MQGIKITLGEFIQRAIKTHRGKYTYGSVKFKNINSKIKINCLNHGIFEQRAHKHLCGQGCPKCLFEGLSKKLDDFIKDAKKVHGNKYIYFKVDYKNAHTKIIIICPIHGEFLQEPNIHLRGSGCPKCGDICVGDLRRLSPDIFIEKANEIHNNKYDYSKVDYKVSVEKVQIICKEHGEFWQTPGNHLSGYGCPKCAATLRANLFRDTKENFIKKAKEIHGNKYRYPNFTYKDNHTKIRIICQKHGEFKQTANNHLHGKGCPKCNYSKGEEKGDRGLKELGVKFRIQKRFSTCKNKKELEFDFYIPKYRLLIEFDGIQHFKPIKQFGGLKALKQTKKLDGIKNKWAKANGYKLLRIKYTKLKKIDTILDNYFKKLERV